ncbi:MAG: MarR family transcriptional regulator [Candidatus Kaelpia aquatica]|nr:MarR family transcriptional regulator [Candidatus Kaelpia aquatica]
MNIEYFAEEVARILPHIIRGAAKNQNDALKNGTITMPQYLALNILSLQGPLKMKDIAAELNISLPATTGLVERLCSIKTAERRYDKKDRRVIYIKITEKGKKIVKNVRLEREKGIIKLFSKLTEKEREDYLNILKKIKADLYQNEKQ